MEKPNLDRTVSQLKDFQRRTVDSVVDKLFGTAETRRFLIADEVGLGKTMVARGIVAESIHRLWDIKERIDVIYVCSNAQIAAQNLNRLNPFDEVPRRPVSRITLLPLNLHHLANRKVNLVSFTPGTSLSKGNGPGVIKERALIHRLLNETWGPWVSQREGTWELMQGAAGIRSYDKSFAQIREADIDPQTVWEYQKRLESRPELEEEFRRLTDGRIWRKSRPRARERNWLIGNLRSVLAASCIELLDPDLVVLDEFQRFTDLLDPETESGELASDLFNYQDNRVLLLSATPYRMFTSSSDEGASHYEDFLKTYDFLVHHDAVKTQELEELLAALRRGIMTGEPLEALMTVNKKIEYRLRQVMIRTERLGSSINRDGMLETANVPNLIPDANDVVTFAKIDRVARHVNAPSIVELWKSSPYLLNFMEDYKLSRGFRDGLDQGDSKIKEVSGGLGMLEESATQDYAPIDLGQPKLRALVDHLDSHKAFDLIWMPPSMPSTELGGAFASPQAQKLTKMLIFSAWGVVPRAISSLLSYEAERRLLGPLGKTYEERRDISSPLHLRVDRDSLPVSNLLLSTPLPAFASLMDPLAYARTHSVSLPLRLEDLKAFVMGSLQEKLAPWLDAAPSEGRTDQRWYWVAPLLLKETPDDVLLQAVGSIMESSSSGEESTAHELMRRALEVVSSVRSGAEQLGRAPDDLADVLFMLGLAGPANAWWRSVSQIAGCTGNDLRVERLSAAAQLGRRVVNIFNQPESQQIVKASTHNAPYWRQVLKYCVQGGLPAVLDEFAHLLVDQIGLVGKPKAQVVSDLVKVAEESTGLRVSSVGVYHYGIAGDQATVQTRAMRVHFASRIGQEKETETGVERAINVREAFNSPFWPFVLISTSVGQEGLDFHPYCHAVGHWNLPTNPVDLEQREGRVHRYKGHAVRKNIARVYGSDPRVMHMQDVWSQAFELAKAERPIDETDLVPYWVFPVEGGARIERHTFPMPLSKDVQRLSDLLKAVATYRLSLGQPRQEDLLEYLQEWYDHEAIIEIAESLKLDLSPDRED